jgi:hypothetical protein
MSGKQPTSDQDQSELMVTMTLGQAQALAEAAEVYCRLSMGQFEHLSELVRTDVIPCRADSNGARTTASTQVCEAIDRMMLQAKSLLGYLANGSHSIGHPHVHLSAHRAWEVRKVISQALAVHRNPTATARGVDHDGLIVRYTQDKAPTALVSTGGTARDNRLVRSHQTSTRSCASKA